MCPTNGSSASANNLQEESGKINGENSSKSFSTRQWMTIIVFGMTNLFMASMFSLQGPFYPKEAESKGASATEYGLVFGAFEFTAFIVSPIYGKYMNWIGPKKCFNLGIFGGAIACTLFGFLDRIDDHTLFISLSFILRILEAIGGAAVCTASFTIIALEFPDSVATTFASLETFFGLGLIVGPTMGGALYQLGGFTLPFLVTGVIVFLNAGLAAYFMPHIPQILDADGKQASGIGIFTLLRIPAVCVAALVVFTCAASTGFLTATLEPHLRPFGLTPLEIGAIFMINGGLYALTAPGWGWVCDKISQPKYIALAGSFFIISGFMLVGPAPFLPIRTLLPLVCVGLVLHGFGLGCCNVSGFIIALKDAVHHGFPDNLSTYAIVSAMWASVLSLGSCLGPSIGGILYDQVGFRNGTLLILVGELLVGAVVIFFIIRERGIKYETKTAENDDPSKPLLESVHTSGIQKSYQGYEPI